MGMVWLEAHGTTLRVVRLGDRAFQRRPEEEGNVLPDCDTELLCSFSGEGMHKLLEPRSAQSNCKERRTAVRIRDDYFPE